MISSALRDALRAVFGERADFDVPLARHTSLRVGGPADALVLPVSQDEVVRLLALCREHGSAWSFLGGGFNVLVLDEGLDGVVVSLRKLRGLTRDGTRVRAEAGVSHSQLTRFCAQHSLEGMAFAVGIPGSVGGWIAMNAGIGTCEMKDVVESVQLVLPDGSRATRSAAQCGFRYRGSDGIEAGAAIVAATFSLARGDAAEIRDEMRRLLDARAQTQPIDVPSCGSVFKNPPGGYAGRLVEAAGLKGHRHGGAQISPIHANFIANTGGASARDVLALIEHARTRVFEQTGVRLETEVRIVGRRGEPA